MKAASALVGAKRCRRKVLVKQDKFQLALAKQLAGKNREAANLYNEIINADPGHAMAYHNLGLILMSTAGPGPAVPLLWYATQVQPDLADARNSLANALQRVGRKEEAEAAFRKAIELDPLSAMFHFNLANLLASMNRHAEAEQIFRKAIDLEPNYVEAYNNLSNILRNLDRRDEALQVLSRALEITPNFALAHNNIGNIKRDLDQLRDAEESYRAAIQSEPDLAIAHFNLGNVLRDTGRTAEAAKSFRRAIDLNPSHADAYRHLVQVENLKPDDGLVALMQARYDNIYITDEDKTHFAFALGRVYDRAEKWDRAFEYFQVANRLHRASYQYDVRSEGQLLKRIKETCTASRWSKLPSSAIDDSTPIFIVGMMRSGTTLMEQILASHSEVVGGGELRYIQDIVNGLRARTSKPYPNCIEGLTQDDADEMGRTYLRRVREAFGNEARFITDKMPQNFVYLGLIERLLPKSRIIYMKRDPMDVALSIFSILFTFGHPYAYDLKEIGQYTRFSEQVMEHWIGLFGEKIHVQSYEDLVADPEHEISKVLDFCGLAFEPACLDFHATERTVNTASASQVRERLNGSSIGRWKPYERYLRPLKAGLAAR